MTRHQRLLELKSADTEQANQADHDQIDRDDVVQKARHDQNKDASDQRDERRQGQVKVHSEVSNTNQLEITGLSR